MTTDPISDMLTRIRNAGMARHQWVEVPASKMKVRIAEILMEEGYIKDFRTESVSDQGKIIIQLKYGPDQRLIIRGMKRLSKPGRRRYADKDGITKVLRGLGISILSTPRGVMSDRTARKMGVGGELLCEVW